VIYTKSLPWRSKKFNEFVARLDIQTVLETSSLAETEKKSTWREKILHTLTPIQLISQIGYLLANQKFYSWWIYYFCWLI